MHKKVVTGLLAAILSVSLMAGCGNTGDSSSSTGSNSNQENTAPGTENSTENSGELIPITFIGNDDPAVETNIFAQLDGVTYEDNVWTELIEERLGYDVQYLWRTSSDDMYRQKLNAALATGEIPDILCVGKEDLQRLIEADLLADIGPYYEEYVSDYYRGLVEAAGDAAIKAATFDGVQYGIPYLDCDLETSPMLWLRQDWLEELNLQAPTTIEELKTLIIAFMEYAGEGSVGMALDGSLYAQFPQFTISGFCNAFGAYPQYWIEDGNGGLVYGSTTSEMKEALAELAVFYAEGLIDPEFYTYDGNKAVEALVNGKCGVMYGFHASSLDYLQRVVNADPGADWLPYLIPMKEKGSTVRPGIMLCTNRWYVVSKKCEHPEALIQLMNLYCEKSLDPELNEYAKYNNPGNGVEGLWKLSPVITTTPNKNQVTAKDIEEPLITGDPGDLSGEELSMWEYSYAAQNGDLTLWGWNRVFGANGSQQLLISYNEDSNIEVMYDQFFGAPGEIMTAQKSTLDDMLNQAFIQIIIGQSSIDTFDDAVEQWKNAGGQAMTDEVNEWYAHSN